ncbi:MAG: hypothetical protein K0U41_03090 [Gammaproteobacteria bacterium]|nr:hypothetical protein [Gammaproteobacteria bacterium]
MKRKEELIAVFLKSLDGHYGWGAGFKKEKGVGAVYFNTHRTKRFLAVVDIEESFKEEWYNNRPVMVMNVKHLRITGINRYKIPYELYMQNLTIPLDGQIREGSSTWEWLRHMKYLARRLAN